jgi:heme exporter protein A
VREDSADHPLVPDRVKGFLAPRANRLAVLLADDRETQRPAIENDREKRENAEKARAHVRTDYAVAMRLVAENLSRSFGRRAFGPVSFRVEAGRVLGVAGENGSGKTTLLKTLAGLIRPSGGWARIFLEGEEARDGHEPRDVTSLIGWCAPDLSLYGELTAQENLTFFERVRGLVPAPGRALALLEGVGLPLESHSKKALSSLSTGQRQRVKLAFATLHEPGLLLLDEPGANLDEAGRSIVEKVVASQRRRGITVIASNDPRDLALSDERVTLS